jgi:GNAT superfamily N-acetyltransferase
MSTITYLEMHSRPESTEPVLPQGKLRIEKVALPPVPFYREMYQAVGGPWNWSERKRLSDSELREVIQHPDIAIYVLRNEGRISGFAEMDLRQKPEIELKYFGLVPECIGKGYGRHFLHWIVMKAWDMQPSRLWLHTCDRDHPGALTFYQESGFVICQAETRRRD